VVAVTAYPFQYAVLRAVPRVDRGEFANIGVIMYCQQAEFLRARTLIDEARLRGLDPDIDLESVTTAAEAVVASCEAAAGSARENDGLAVRFGMLTAPRSTVVQPSPIHAGLTDDPERTLADLLSKLVAPIG
jgi:Protein of unknown function (DUF3037)